jgi:3-phenylpropionate/cinnamic acid dioxygenase small subunit
MSALANADHLALEQLLPSSAPAHAEVVAWIDWESHLLDDWRYDEWIELLHPEVFYSMPLRLSVMPKDGQGFVAGMDYYDDDYRSLVTRVLRLRTDQAWAEQPGSRTRHLLTNHLIAARGEDEYHVRSQFLVTRARADRPFDLFSGERRDDLVRVDGRLLLRQRVLLLDQTVLKSYNLSILL